MFHWANYLSLAQELATRKDQEAALRSAISRAYYAVFCKARNALLEEGSRIPSAGSVHSFVWNTYLQAADPRRKSIGLTGHRLRIDRNRADYHDIFHRIDKVVQGDLVVARKLLDELHEPRPAD